jgi:uncharacterized protein YpuA (DUF1002 family)
VNFAKTYELHATEIITRCVSKSGISGLKVNAAVSEVVKQMLHLDYEKVNTLNEVDSKIKRIMNEVEEDLVLVRYDFILDQRGFYNALTGSQI